MNKQKGQVIIIILLIMLVALSLALTLTQRSVTDVTVSSQADQSSRAFSAAEAGIEKALSDSFIPQDTNVSLGNNSSAKINQSGLMPYAADVAIEYPKIGRETTAQIWFVDPSATVIPPAAYYNSASYDLYYGNANTTDKPAVEVSTIILNNSGFLNYIRYYDSELSRSGSGAGRNGFTQTSCTNPTVTTSILGSNRQFHCRQTIGPVPNLGASGNCAVATCKMVMVRVRFLYTNENHSLAVAPTTGNRLPPQVQIYNSVGTSGQSQKQIQAFRVKDVVLPWFDFAIFSTNEIRK